MMMPVCSEFFVLQSDKDVCVMETRSVRLCELMSKNIVTHSNIDGLARIKNKSLIPVGTVEFCCSWMALVGVSMPDPLDYPESLSDFFGRKIGLYETYADAPDGKFVKPFQTKAWESHIKRHGADFSGRVWACDQLSKIIAEWRVYVLDGAIVGIGRYDEFDGEHEFDLKYAETVVYRYFAGGDAPVSFGIDIGLIDGGSFVVIEVNDAWALGLYKCDVLPMERCAYRDMLARRWDEIKRRVL